ncbi:hypothetical protein PRK78_006345 [Emydomyces testavorans]|uniref:Protein kinase domain-containing protein n=1 Tax=Emydomyces testavorans TaxID=2070801 RepID=A0AAF0DLK9_9EURO|nr:hypothetical protein PRK78_006345 [Emydomyces testavorans]
MEMSARDAEIEKILLWISAISFSQKHIDVLETVQPGTAQWLLRNETFRDWVKGAVDVLWCPGIPGAGKITPSCILLPNEDRELAVTKTLLRWGADVNVKDGDGWSVLMSAVRGGRVGIIRMLIEGGVDVSAATAREDNALSLATRNGQGEIANCLADAGAILLANDIGQRASATGPRKGLQNIVRRLSKGYAALPARELQRQEHAHPSARECNELTESTEQSMIFSEDLDSLDSARVFERRYEIVRDLDEGRFARVYLCRSKVKNVRYAAKCFKPHHASIKNEIIALTELHHQNILRMINLIADGDMKPMYPVLEMTCEGELFDFIVERGKLSEPESRSVFTQLFSALEFLHGQGWIHCDIKPENILLRDKIPAIKLCHSGLMTYVGLGGTCSALAGTPRYVAPEVLARSVDRSYSFPVDIWSAGVVLYICLCGFPPFSDELYSEDSPYTLGQQILGGRFDYPSPYWDFVDNRALDLIDSMLNTDPTTRFTVSQCLNHGWIKMTWDFGSIID